MTGSRPARGTLARGSDRLTASAAPRRRPDARGPAERLRLRGRLALGLGVRLGLGLAGHQEAAILTAAVWRSTPKTALVSRRPREVFVLPAFSSNFASDTGPA